MTVEFETEAEARCGMCWKGAKWRSVLVPCLSVFAIPLLVPGLTLTIVASNNNDSSGGLVRYGALHVIGIVLLVLSGLLLFMALVLGCCCRESPSRVSPDLEDGGSLESNSMDDPELTGHTHSTHEAKIPESNGVLVKQEPKSQISGHFVNHMIPEDDKEPPARPPVENPQPTNDNSSHNSDDANARAAKDQTEMTNSQPRPRGSLAAATVKAAGPQRTERSKDVARSGWARGEEIGPNPELKEASRGAAANPREERALTRGVRAALPESGRSSGKQVLADPKPKNICNFMEADSDEEQALAAKYAAAAEAFPRDRNGLIRNMSTLTSSDSEDSDTDDDDLNDDVSEESAVGCWDDETSGSVFESPKHQKLVKATIHDEQTVSDQKKFRAKFIQGKLDEEIKSPSKSPIKKSSSLERSSSQDSQPSPVKPALATVHEEEADPSSAANREFVARTTLRRAPAEDLEGSPPQFARKGKMRKSSRKRKEHKDTSGRQPQPEASSFEAAYDSGYTEKTESASATESPSHGTSSLRRLGSEEQPAPELGWLEESGPRAGFAWGPESSPERAVLYAETPTLSRSPVPLPAWPSSCFDPRHVTVLGAKRGSISSASREGPSSPPPPELSLGDPLEMGENAEKETAAEKEDVTAESATANKKTKKKKKKRGKERRRRRKSKANPDEQSAASTDASGLQESRQGRMRHLPDQPETETHTGKSESSPHSSVERHLKPIVHDPQHHTDHHVHWPDTPLSPPATES